MIISADEIKKVRIQEGCSLQEARESLINRNLLKSIQEATTIEDIKDILIDIINYKF